MMTCQALSEVGGWHRSLTVMVEVIRLNQVRFLDLRLPFWLFSR